MLNSFGVGVPEFVDLVNAAETEEDVAQRLWENVAVDAEALSARLRRLTVGDVPPELRATFQTMYGDDLPQIAWSSR